jgi:hypothetical protein
MAATTISRTNIGTNDDGSGTTGTVINVAYIGLAIYDAIDALFSASGGITLNQGSTYLSIITLESSNVAHGMTSLAGTSAFAQLIRQSDTQGGILLRGYTEGTSAATITGYGTTDNTTKTSAALAQVELQAGTKSGTSITNVGANGNLVIISNAGTVRFIFDAEGDMHYDGAAPANYDTWDDVALARALDQTFRGPDLIETEWDRFVQYSRADLERAGIVSDGGFVNLTKHTRLLNGALWQQHCRIKTLESRLLAIEGRA